MLGLLLGIKHLVELKDLIDQDFVGLGYFAEQFLELLDLLLRCRQLFRDNADVMIRSEVLIDLLLSRRRCLASDIV